MERYQEYKDSGEQWLGEIPSHWEMRKMKYTFRERSEKGFPNEPLLAATQSHGVILKTDYEGRTVEATKGLDTLKLVEIGDFVISLRSFQGGLEYAYNRGIISPAYTILNPTNITKDYFKYLAKSQVFISLLKSTITGIREGQNIDYSKLKENLMPIPPIGEQVKMGQHLDRITAQIDKAIAQQQRMIDLLNERKQIIIQHAVTKGLDPNAEMVDSGVEWIGKIPKGWKLYKLKHLLQDPLKYGANESASEYNETDPRYIRITDIDNEGNLKNNTVCTIPLHKALPYMLQKGDLLLARSGATVGKSYLFQEDYKACYAGYLIKACFSKKISPQFVYLYTQSASYSKWKDYILIQSTIQNISAEKYANLLIPTPPVEVQLSILKYLDPQLDKMNVTLANFNRKIEVLRERKQIIINEVVTGKVKVS